MVNQIFDYIGVKLKIANPWIDTYAVNCVEMPIKNGNTTTKRVVNFEGFEKEDFSINDARGTGFYIKIDPIFEYGASRQLSSSQKEYSVTIKFRLLFFSINASVERKKVVLENILVSGLRQMSFLDYTGGEKTVSIQVNKSNTTAEAIFKEETGIDLQSGAQALFIAVDGKISFVSTNENCESECGTSTSENLLQSYNFCNPNVFALLTAAQKQCLADQLVLSQKLFKQLSFTGDIDGTNVDFTTTVEIIQVFKNGQLLFLDTDYTLSVDKKTATLLVTPNPAFDDSLKIFGNI